MPEFDVLITDASQRVALEVIRSLGVKKLRILAVEKESTAKNAFAQSSKYCHSFLTVPDYTGNEFISLCAKSKTVFPISTNTIHSARYCKDGRDNRGN